MARALDEYFRFVHPSDVHDYGYGHQGDSLFPSPAIAGADWIITNPPFRLATQFIQHAIPLAHEGVAMLCRTVFLESGKRWRDLYQKRPPSDVLIFSERVPMLKGRLVKKASSATSYAWFVWRHDCSGQDCDGTHLHWIPPGTRKRLEKEEDYE